MSIADKLDALTLIAKVFRENKIDWALGGSTLLYLKGIVREFNDIDIMIKEQDKEIIKELLSKYVDDIILTEENTNKFTLHMQCYLNNVPIELFDGMRLGVDEMGKRINFSSFYINECVMLSEETIPLMACNDWCRWYLQMGRIERAELMHKMNHLW